MANSGTLLPVLLFALVVTAGVIVEGLNGYSTFAPRREAIEVITPVPAANPPPGTISFAPQGPTPSCPPNTCTNATLPNCCVNPEGFEFCTNFQTNDGACGGCDGLCAPAAEIQCCNGVCVDYDIDNDNCGSCGFRCGATCTCIDGVCTE